MLVYRSALIAALGGLLFGFDTAVISGTVSSLKKEFFLNDWWLGLTVASALFGTILGAATAQIPSNRSGRKPTLLLMAILYFVSAVGSACPWNFGTLGTLDWWLFLFARFIGGIAVGASSVVSPLYTAEISPAKNRGFLVAFTQFNIVFGILLAFFTNYLIVRYMPTCMPSSAGMEWRWMFGVEAIPAAMFFFLLLIVPESPRWLIGRGQTDKAKSIIQQLGTDEGRGVEEEVNLIRATIEEEAQYGKATLFTRRLWFPVTLAICIAAFNQLSGINAVLYYAPSVFSMAGASKELAMFLPVVIGFTNLIFTMAAMAVIDNFGRKKLMIAGSLGYITSLGVVAAAFMIYAPQFNVSTANFMVQETQAKVQQCQEALDHAPMETKDFWETELKNALLDCIEALESSYNARHKANTGEDREIGLITVHDRREDDIETLKSYIADQEDFDLSPTVPWTGILIVLVGLMAFIASHAFGQGACIWVFLSEIFPQEVRAQGTALGCFVHWFLAATVSMLFPPLLGLLGTANVFFMFSGFMVLQLIWVLTMMPETKQVPLEEMQKKLGIK
jgi:sugar porter (SP) family MFS transporter